MSEKNPIAEAIVWAFTSEQELCADLNGANVVDRLGSLARAVNKLAESIDHLASAQFSVAHKEDK